MASLDTPQSIRSILDTDLYKLTMQRAVRKFFPQTAVTYAFHNRTPEMRLSREAFNWLEEQINALQHLQLTDAEYDWLRARCPFFDADYLDYLKGYRFRPRQHVSCMLDPVPGHRRQLGNLHITICGLWVDTILYEIPLLALTSEAYFRFCDRDWNHDGQEAAAYDKAMILLECGCRFSDFGTRRRRDYRTQELVLSGLIRAAKDGREQEFDGRLGGTSNVHFAMTYKIPPIGTMAHEWFMGIAASTQDYSKATDLGLSYWIQCFGEGVLGIALTDTFSSPIFLDSFRKQYDTRPPKTLTTGWLQGRRWEPPDTFAHIFPGVRHDSGNPRRFIPMLRKFYDRMGILGTKKVVFSDSLNISRCLEGKRLAEQYNFEPSFGIGTFFTNDFKRENGKKSLPLNIVIKLSSAGGHAAVKISDDVGKNTGNAKAVADVKRQLGIEDHEWLGGNESRRWGDEDGNDGIETSDESEDRYRGQSSSEGEGGGDHVEGVDDHHWADDYHWEADGDGDGGEGEDDEGRPQGLEFTSRTTRTRRQGTG